MIAIRTWRLEIPEGTGARTASNTHHFDRQVERYWVALRGYKLGYGDNDHHVRTVSVDLSAGLEETDSGPGVVVEATLLLEDKNGDDTFTGWAEYILFVELGRRLVGGEAPEPEPAAEEAGPVQKE